MISMEKIYVFNNWRTKKRSEKSLRIEIKASTILEAKRKADEAGYGNMEFQTITLHYGQGKKSKAL